MAQAIENTITYRIQRRGAAGLHAPAELSRQGCSDLVEIGAELLVQHLAEAR